ncbi:MULTISPECIES: nickel-dependent hydrogenase large subunit [Rhodopseudomonas]|uniref:nickel-dependent hydrogenase large subunit n=1 Tax=Rhodopseudomonas TaxID=1073 RepID=UPI000A7C8414|nr:MULTISPECIES: nickel-dependent hydrogenase large subunit [Rhodopseudomonas]MDF3809529.1 nickel-dependent hydrogenase large subunit [Rhodopseudomonas sp. BAL398]WOK19731.1 nickel-dependent hydrogenase large subunit [Rhodopseudomonas sp. BAL398]
MGQWIDAGAVRVAVDVAGGRVVARTVRSDRPRGLASTLTRHPPAAIPDLVRRIFALCGTSHAIAAANALVMAGAAIAAPPAQTAVRQLAAERITAHLQATFMGWSATVPLTALEAAALSRALVATRAMGSDGEAMIAALDALGLSADRRVGSWADRLLGAADGQDGDRLRTLDALGAVDDHRVLAMLERQGETFAASPWLRGRRPETGPAARAALRGFRAVSSAQRLGARLNEIAEAAFVMTGAQADPDEWLVAGRCDPGTGYCAVETPRGRLYHLAQLGPDGAVQRFLIVAPTEWNFACDGPFALALDQLRVKDADPRAAIARLAMLYDPCVGCDVELRQTPAVQQGALPESHSEAEWLRGLS